MPARRSPRKPAAKRASPTGAVRKASKKASPARHARRRAATAPARRAEGGRSPPAVVASVTTPGKAGSPERDVTQCQECRRLRRLVLQQELELVQSRTRISILEQQLAEREAGGARGEPLQQAQIASLIAAAQTPAGGGVSLEDLLRVALEAAHNDTEDLSTEETSPEPQTVGAASSGTPGGEPVHKHLAVAP
eukprot:TRINITY_DN2176_c0_g1_i4.p1 TRINITY_DN2176_c0_g1~~TRINITY_DN2176_c0_g1_i4.p1  ORF type:complete len:221 (+),score=61.26 TRINITY_DN2176_c0_g1_i4:87-665(+)